ncbi:hypothetical protein EV182_002005, partial [Spiromyces aspiralis]
MQQQQQQSFSSNGGNATTNLEARYPELPQFAKGLSEGNPDALKMLEAFLENDDAWYLALYLLSQNDTNCQFYGALSLQTKISRDYEKLSEQDRIGLRDELVHQLKQFMRGPAIVFRKLSQAVIVCAQHLVPAQWSNVAVGILQAFDDMAVSGTVSSDAKAEASLEFLCIASEDASQCEGPLKDDFNAAAGDLVNFVSLYFEPGAEPRPTLKKAWNALASLIQFNIPFDPMLVSILSFAFKRLEFLASQKTVARSAGRDFGVYNEEIDAAIRVLEEISSNRLVEMRYSHTMATLLFDNFAQPWVESEIKFCID